MIVYLDADDMLEPNFTTEVLRAFDAGFDCVGVPVTRVSTANTPLRLTSGNPSIAWVPRRPHDGQGELCFLRACGLALTGPALALNEVWPRIPPAFGGTCDLFWSWAAYASTARICWTMRPCYRYRMTNADVYPTYGLHPPPDANPNKSHLHRAHHDAWNILDRDGKADVLKRIGITQGYRVTAQDADAATSGIQGTARLLAQDSNRRFQVI